MADMAPAAAARGAERVPGAEPPALKAVEFGGEWRQQARHTLAQSSNLPDQAFGALTQRRPFEALPLFRVNVSGGDSPREVTSRCDGKITGLIAEDLRQWLKRHPTYTAREACEEVLGLVHKRFGGYNPQISKALDDRDVHSKIIQAVEARYGDERAKLWESFEAKFPPALWDDLTKIHHAPPGAPSPSLLQAFRRIGEYHARKAAPELTGPQVRHLADQFVTEKDKLLGDIIDNERRAEKELAPHRTAREAVSIPKVPNATTRVTDMDSLTPGTLTCLYYTSETLKWLRALGIEAEGVTGEVIQDRITDKSLHTFVFLPRERAVLETTYPTLDNAWAPALSLGLDSYPYTLTVPNSGILYRCIRLQETNWDLPVPGTAGAPAADQTRLRNFLSEAFARPRAFPTYRYPDAIAAPGHK